MRQALSSSRPDGHIAPVGWPSQCPPTTSAAPLTQRLAIVRQQGNEALISSEAGNLSMVERQLGNLTRADELVREALTIAQRRGDEFMKPFALSGLAALATLPEAMGTAEFERARAAGRAMASGDAVDFALGAGAAG